MDSPLVSICIPTYNSGTRVWRALESALNQTHRSIEIIVSDNASSDNTWEIVLEYAKRDPRIKFFQNETNVGSGNNFLKAFEHASGEYVQALGSDDWLSRNYVEEGLKNFEKYPDAAAVVPDIISFELDKESNQLKFLDDLPLRPGIYASEWLFGEIYKGGNAPTGFISLLRRADMIHILREGMANPAYLVQRGDKIEPFDMPIFLEIAAKYKNFVITKNSAYVKTVHGRDHVGLKGFDDLAGPVRYALLTRKAYEFFFLRHGLKKHFRNLRLWNGLSLTANALSGWLRRRDAAKKSYAEEFRLFFVDYSRREKINIVFFVMPYVLLKLGMRFKFFFKKHGDFKARPNYFVAQDMKFHV